jgi:hypothetical protein
VNEKTRACLTELTNQKPTKSIKEAIVEGGVGYIVVHTACYTMLLDTSTCILTPCNLTVVFTNVAVSFSGCERSVMETLCNYLFPENSVLKRMILKRMIRYIKKDLPPQNQR